MRVGGTTISVFSSSILGAEVIDIGRRGGVCTLLDDLGMGGRQRFGVKVTTSGDVSSCESGDVCPGGCVEEVATEIGLRDNFALGVVGGLSNVGIEGLSEISSGCVFG